MTWHPKPNALRLIHGFYWLALAGAFGATLMLALGAAATFHSVREFSPIITAPPYNDPLLTQQAPGIIAGAATGAALDALWVLHLLLFSVVVLTTLLQCTHFRAALPGGGKSIANFIRIALLVAILALLAGERWIISPRVWSLRDRMYNSTLNDTDRAAARAEFDTWHQSSTRVMGAALLAMAVAVLVSPFAIQGISSSDAPRHITGGLTGS